MSKVALITGITGQDGSYLAELLLNKGYTVHGIVRRTSTFNRERIDNIHSYVGENKVILHYGDVSDSSSVFNILKNVEPDEIYHLAAQSHVGISFETPEYTSEVNAIGTLRILEGIRSLDINPKFYNAATSELFGNSNEDYQNENTPFNPSSPYGIAKLFSYHICKNYRESYGMFNCNGILFNHESPRRGKNFVSRKITTGISDILLNKQDCLYLGNLESKRDWGYAPEYVDAMWKIVNHVKPKDYCIATGEPHSVREFVELAFKEVDIDIKWRGKGIKEKGIDSNTSKTLIKISPRYLRSLDVNYLCGDYSKAKRELDWTPKTTFKELIKIMVNSDLKHASKYI